MNGEFPVSSLVFMHRLLPDRAAAMVTGSGSETDIDSSHVNVVYSHESSQTHDAERDADLVVSNRYLCCTENVLHGESRGALPSTSGVLPAAVPPTPILGRPYAAAKGRARCVVAPMGPLGNWHVLENISRADP